MSPSVERWLSVLVFAWVGCGKEPPQTQVPPQWSAGTAAPLGGGEAPGDGAGTSGGATLAGAGSVATGGRGGGTTPAASGGGGVPAVTAGEPNKGVPTPPGGKFGSWASYGGDLAHSRSSPNETLISVMNAKDLKPAFDLAAPGVTSTPAVVGGVIYWADWGGTVHATNLRDQKPVWDYDRSMLPFSGYTGSPSVTEKAVYVANRNGLVSALDRKTGTPLWERKIDAGPHTHIWSSPIVAEADNVVILGVAGLGTRDNSIAISSSQLQSFHGWVEGMDAITGEMLWQFMVTPMPDGAGVSVWSSAAIDTTRKLAFIGTGNNYYRPVSKYSDSLLALDYMTGTYKWHSQYTMNDAWTVGTVIGGGVDGDVGATPNLFSIDGKDVVGVGDKQGRYFVHDRMTGERLWMKALTNSGYQGGVMAPAAYSNGVIYVISNNDTISSTVFALDAKTNAEKWRVNLTQPTYGGPAIGNGVLYVGDQAGNMWALNAADGMKLWQRRLPQGRGGGFSLVDGMLYTGYGFHFSESRREPLTGGLAAFSTTGSAVLTEGTDTTGCVPNTTVTSAATFTNVYQGVLCPAGCTNVCHSTSGEAGLVLEGKAAAHKSLVNVAAKGEACKTGGHMLVVPGNPTASLLHGKLALMPACGVAMPPTATAATTPITPAMLEAVRAWIAAGAPDN